MSSKLNWTAASIGLAVALLLMTASAGAAVTQVPAGSATSGVLTNVAGGSTVDLSVNMTGVDVLVAFVQSSDGGGVSTHRGSAVTLGGSAMTWVSDVGGAVFLGESKNGSHYACGQIFYAVNSGLTGSQTVRLTLPASSFARMVFSAIGFTGVDKTNPLISSGYNRDFSNKTVYVTLSTLADSMVVFSSVQDSGADITPTPGTSVELYAAGATTGQLLRAETWDVASPAASQTVGFTVGASTAGVTSGLALRPRDVTPPQLAPTGAIVRVNPSPTNAAQVNWTVTFTESVTGVDAADFALATAGGVTGATIASVTGSGATRNVLVNTGTGSGSLGLNLVDNDTIVDAAGNTLGGTGTGTVYVGEAYSIDKDPPTATSIVINGGATYTTSSAVTLTLAATGATQMSFNNGLGWSSWAPYGTTYSWGLEGTDGTKTVQARFRDALGNESAPVNDSIILDTTAPTGEIFINGLDDPYATKNPAVVLYLSATDAGSGVTAMQFSSDGVNWGTPEPYATTFNGYPPLPGPDGQKAVYALFWDAAGNSYSTYDTIVLDTTGPNPAQSSVVINGNAPNTNNPNVTLTLEAIDDFGEVEFMSISNDNSAPWTRVPYATSYPWTLAGPDGTNTVYVRFEDDLGNWTLRTDDILLDTAKPTGTMSINSDAEFTNSNSASVVVTTADTDVFEIQYSADNATWSGWQAYDGAADLFPLGAGDGLKTVYAQLRDVAGNVSETEISDTITLDQTPPAGSVVIAAGATAVNYNPVELTVNATDATSGVASMRFSNDGAAWSTPEAYATSKNWWLSAGEGTKSVFVKFIDNAGNESSGLDGADTIEFDTTAPSAPDVTGPGNTNDTTPTWFWTSRDGAGPETMWQWQLNGGPWSDPYTDTNFTPELPLSPDGEYTLCVRESDAAGNWSEPECVSITIDTLAPNAPSVSGPVATRNLRPTWSWLSGGGDGIGQYRYQLNGTDEEGWSLISQLTFTPIEPLGDKLTHTLYVQERDAVGNWSSSGSWAILVDSDLVTAPTVSGVTPTNDTTPLWTWVSGGGLDQYRYQLDGEDEGEWTETVDMSWEPTEPVAEGVYTLYVQQRLTPLMWSESGSFAITVDLTLPEAPIVTSNGTPRDGQPDITNSLQPVWFWTPGGGGNGTFRYQIDGEGEDGWTETTGTVLAPADPLAEGIHTMYVQERDEAGNWSASGERAVEIDTTNPNPPVVTAPARTSLVRPMWTWVSGGNGNGTYRYQLDSEDEGGWTVTKTLSFVPGSDLAEGIYTLYVQELDDATNWSASGSATVSVEPNAPDAPVVASPAITSNPQPTWTWSSGGGSGNYRYQFDGEGGAWTPTTGTSFTPGPLAEGFHTLYVQEASETGVWSASGSSTTQVDFTAPNAPIVTGPGVTADSTPTWTWTSGGGGNGTFRYMFDTIAGEWTETTETQFTPGTVLSAGPHILYVEERDEAGNWSEPGSWSVSVQLAGPQPPVVSGPAFTNNLQPRWTWVSGGNGNGRFRYQLNSEVGAWQLTTAISFRPLTPFSDGAYTLFVQEQDSLGNWSQSGSWAIVVDTVPPLPPVLTGATPVRTKRPTWAWTSGGGGGTGLFRVQIDTDEDAWILTDQLSYTPDLPLEKNAHTLYAQEADAAGNWSVSTLYTIVIDPNAVLSPIISGVTPTNDTTPTWTWEAAPDSGGTGKFSYRFNGGDWIVSNTMSFTPAAPLAQGQYTVEVREGDVFNEWSWPGSFTITINLGLPVITVVGDNPAEVTAGTVYTDEGATAVDANENDITDDIVVTGLPVDTNILGSYSVTYSLAGYSVEAVRTVNVVSGVTEVGIASPMEGATLYLPAEGAKVLLALTSVAPADTESVTYTLDDVEVGTATEAPWLVVAEIAPSAAQFGEHVIVATADEPTKATVDEVDINFAELPADADQDANGIPDNPFATLGVGDMWADDGIMVLRADGPTPIAAGAPYVVALVNPANDAQRLTATVSPSVLEPTDLAAIILKAADGLVELLGATEAALVADPPVGYAVADDLYGSVNVAVSENGTDFWNLEGEILEDYPVVVTAQNDLDAAVDLLLHGAEVMSDAITGVYIGIPEAAGWDDEDVVDLDVAGGAATATLEALGLVAVFEPAAEGEGEGEGEGEDNGGCFAANLQPPTAPRSGDGLVMLLAVALLLPVLRLRQRANPVR